jgi:predicted nucleic acid-binding Zn finger protein
MKFNYKYGGSSGVINNANNTQMSFAPDTLREPTFFVGQLHEKIAFREAISALNAVVVSDLRFQPKDKTAYKEWAKQQEDIWLAEYLSSKVGDVEQIKKRSEEVIKEIQGIDAEQSKIMGTYYSARSKYFSYLYEKDRYAWFVLDPVITVHPDQVFFECFSQDESTYGKLSCSYNVFKEISEFECGTTNIDYSAALYNEFQKIRKYKETEFKIDPSGFEVQTGNEDLYKEVKIDLPDSWVRGFLQVSSAMTLPATTFEVHPMDIYTLCSYLRRFKEQHGPRSLRFVLVPDKPVKVIIEPWNHEVVFHRSIFKGGQAQEVRIWGRRRLLTLERLIPLAKRFHITFLGSGLPSFYEADLGEMNYTLGLSGWTSNDWSRAGNFDLMAPRMTVDSITKQNVFAALKETWYESTDSLSARLGLSSDIVAGALSAYTQAGRVIYDRYNGVYRLRELSREPLDMESLRFASPQEEKANLLLLQSKVSITSVEQLAKGQVKIQGKVQDRHLHLPFLVIDGDDRMVQAGCDCNFYNMNKLRKGPCEHILALRMAYNQQQGKGI